MFSNLRMQCGFVEMPSFNGNGFIFCGSTVQYSVYVAFQANRNAAIYVVVEGKMHSH